MTKILGPLPCIACHRLVFWDRVGSDLRLLERYPKTIRRHFCPTGTAHRHSWKGGRVCLTCGITAGCLASRNRDWYAGQRALAFGTLTPTVMPSSKRVGSRGRNAPASPAA